ncbi:uncharacterized protein SRS1_13382 [Sporisorium reilianum f. sp. reilianum]|uniref:Effector family protein Eff1 n=1 Tax=Sporisorium reilianum f. sp. reilianum TaxID=72559 RepID=A0A2N8UCS0_9BASI|nr:uncharacterized protein SRS1_13382 [Sporisorium reilianum f. sp. reilianum]
MRVIVSLALVIASVGLHVAMAIPMDLFEQPNSPGYPHDKQSSWRWQLDLNQPPQPELHELTYPPQHRALSSAAQPSVAQTSGHLEHTGFPEDEQRHLVGLLDDGEQSHPSALQPSAHGEESGWSEEDERHLANLLDDSDNDDDEPSSVEQFQGIQAVPRKGYGTVLVRIQGRTDVHDRIDDLFDLKLNWATQEELDKLTAKVIRGMTPYERSSRILPIDGVKSSDGSPLSIYMTIHGNTPKRPRTSVGSTFFDRNHYKFFGLERKLKKGKGNEIFFYGAASFQPSDCEALDDHLKRVINLAKEAAGHARP